VRDKRKTLTVGGDQTGERVFAHDGRSVLGEVELLGKVHVDECTKPACAFGLKPIENSDNRNSAMRVDQAPYKSSW
jgi:hypothetical protein